MQCNSGTVSRFIFFFCIYIFQTGFDKTCSDIMLNERKNSLILQEKSAKNIYRLKKKKQND